MSEALLCYLSQYLGFGVIFAVGLVVCARQGSIGWGSRRLRSNLWMLVSGYLFFVVLHGILQFVTPGL